ncbi:putative xyloglucan endotransglucosylase/hydrolase protein 30 [Camellia lanceoleosa]|uniref:Xyloglucan endotransglucosylase/hydrolase protein 30 n=1 Tax=Camellia lanceoleosa TaxID=1840588 RepID=A0ACC0G3N6_9ERIC|nr:putative xyloglucan endotransglucosylase/hydrolase protein 30 [Camellia lanceoleosa]
MDRLRCSLSRTTITPSLSLLLFSLLFLLCNIPNLASAAAGFNNLSTITFSKGYNPLFSDFNILRSSDDRTVSLLLNRFSGSGFISSDYYNYELFSAKIKLPSNYSAGIVVAFYISSSCVEREMAKTDKVSAPSRPTIILPPRTSFDSIFAGLSPGPMTLVSSFFSDSYSDSDCSSFSQLLAGAMGSPVAADGGIPTLPQLFSQ